MTRELAIDASAQLALAVTRGGLWVAPRRAPRPLPRDPHRPGLRQGDRERGPRGRTGRGRSCRCPAGCGRSPATDRRADRHLISTAGPSGLQGADGLVRDRGRRSPTCSLGTQCVISRPSTSRGPLLPRLSQALLLLLAASSGSRSGLRPRDVVGARCRGPRRRAGRARPRTAAGARPCAPGSARSHWPSSVDEVRDEVVASPTARRAGSARRPACSRSCAGSARASGAPLISGPCSSCAGLRRLAQAAGDRRLVVDARVLARLVDVVGHLRRRAGWSRRRPFLGWLTGSCR